MTSAKRKEIELCCNHCGMDHIGGRDIIYFRLAPTLEFLSVFPGPAVTVLRTGLFTNEIADSEVV